MTFPKDTPDPNPDSHFYFKPYWHSHVTIGWQQLEEVEFGLQAQHLQADCTYAAITPRAWIKEMEAYSCTGRI